MYRFKPPRFSLRTLLIATAVIGALLAAVEQRVLRPSRAAVELAALPGVSLLLASDRTLQRPLNDLHFRDHPAAPLSQWTYLTDSVYEVHIDNLFSEGRRANFPATAGRLLCALPNLREVDIWTWGGGAAFLREIDSGLSVETLRIFGDDDAVATIQAIARFRRVPHVYLSDVKATVEDIRLLRGSSVRKLHLGTPCTPAYSPEMLARIREAVPEIAVEVD